MGFEVWIVIVLLASGLSGWVGYALAKKDAPKQSELDAMSAELDEARQQADSVQENVSEHFEQSALLFGKLAADYREFLDHFESSAQNLGLSEARARELIAQGFQPLLTHEAQTDAVVAEHGTAATADESAPESAEETEVVTGEDSDDSTVAASASAESEPLPDEPQPATADVGEVTVELPDELPDELKSEVTTASGDSDETPETERQRA